MSEEDLSEEEKKMDAEVEVFGMDTELSYKEANPAMFINQLIFYSNRALLTDDPKIGFIRYSQMIERFEDLCRASGLIGEEYDAEIQKYMQSSGFTKEEDKFIQTSRLTHFKDKLLLKAYFSRSVDKKSPLRM